MHSDKINFIGNLFQKHPKTILCIALCILTIAAYWPVKNYPFINLDDSDSVYGNKHITSGLTVQNVVWAFSLSRADKTEDKQYWQPMARVSHMIDVSLFGVDPHKHHVTNLFFHTANTLLLFLVFFMMTGALWKCFFVAVLFALHPINIESVAWIAERKNLLFTTFWMITMLAYIYYAKKPSISRYLLVLFALGCGLMSKPYIAVLPCALLLMDYWPLKRTKWGCRLNTHKNHQGAGSFSKTAFSKASSIQLILEKIPLLFLSIATILTLSIMLAGKSQVVLSSIRPLSIRIENALISYVIYLYKMIWPVDLAIFYPFPVSIPVWQPIAAAIFLIAVTGLFLFYAKKKPYLIIGWLWFLGVLFPVIGLIQTGKWPALADRHAYVSFIGIFMAIAWGIPDLLSKWHYKKAILSISAACMMMILFLGTRAQLGYWENTYTLFNRALAVTENNFLAYQLVAEELVKKGDYKTAEKYFLTAIHIKPDAFEAKEGLGELAFQNKNYDKALDYYQQALLLRPSNARIMCIIGDLLRITGKPDNAVRYYSDALAIAPSNPEIYNQLGTVFFSKQLFAKARENFEAAVKLNPQFDDAYYNLGMLASKQGNINAAFNHYKEAIRINPDNGNARKSLADLLFSQGDLDHAAEQYSEALRINPNDATTHYNIGVILYHQKKIKAAAEHFYQALQIDNSYEKAKVALAMTRNILSEDSKR